MKRVGAYKILVLWIPSDCNGTFGLVFVDRVYLTKCVNNHFVVCEGSVRAWLEEGRIARSPRIVDVNAGKESLHIDSRTAATSVSQHVRAGPIRLEKAENLWSLYSVAALVRFLRIKVEPFQETHLRFTILTLLPESLC